MDQFKIHQIKDSDDQYFTGFWSIYTTSFPLYERRNIVQQTTIFKKSEYQTNAYISDDQLIGIISFWTTKKFIFIEHLAIAPEFRNKGKGNTVLKSFIESKPIPVILEIELPVDNITRSRLRFYLSLNFKVNEHNHYQPAYHKEDKPIPMKILSYPSLICDLSYQQFVTFQKEIVMGIVS